MATLLVIGYTAVGGVVIAALTFIFFAVAVRARSVNIAPRATARSKDTIYNLKARRGKRSFFLFGRRNSKLVVNDDHDHDEGEIIKKEHQDLDEKKEVQYRGGPMFGWIPWTMSLSYDQLLNGVPGTGTRKGGMEGSFLKVNLDGIILLRFHALCLRVSILATLIGLLVILPLNLTARCYAFADADSISLCNSTNYTLTDYEQTTLSNIPSLGGGSSPSKKWLYGWFGSSISIFGSNSSAYLGRLYAVVLFSWILVGYSLHLTKREWVDCLALRRVYYLEGLHWENREEELHATVFHYESDEEELEEEEKPGALRRRRLINRGKKGPTVTRRKKKKKKDAPARDPWIPHPEQRETVPNIELYSVLVGNVPSLPSEVAAGDLESMGFSKKQALDWQLAVTSTFFDQCVPNQPGFSSSVAAVTILPDAPKLARAWRAWYKHVGLLRRLRFVRSLIDKKRYYELDEVGDSDLEEGWGESDSVGAIDSNTPMGEGKSLDVLFPPDNNSPESEGKAAPAPILEERRASLEFGASHEVDDHLSADTMNDSKVEAAQMREVQHRINYYKDVFGVNFDAENEVTLNDTLLMYALEYGPEQTAVYSREFAQGAAACCPNGCREERLLSYELGELENRMEQITEALKQSFVDLKDAQNSSVESEKNPEFQGTPPSSDINNSGHIKNVKSLEDMKLPSKYDAETRLYHKTPTKFSCKDANEEEVNEVIADTTPRLGRYEQSLPTIMQRSPQEASLRLPDVPSSGTISISNQGRFVVKESYGLSGDEQSDTNNSLRNRKATLSDDWPKDITSPSIRIRQRANTGFSALSVTSEVVDTWRQVENIIEDVQKGVAKVDQRQAFNGIWNIPTSGSIIQSIRDTWHSMTRHTKSVVEDFASESTFAVVTFTSRQAAIAARHCLADGRGVERWTPVAHIPVPPLADAAAGDLKTCRGCCRPVTLTINSNQQLVRRNTALLMLAVIYVFYTIPLSLIAGLASPANMKALIPGLGELTDVNPFLETLLQGVVPAALNCLFFSLCPIIFKAISNFGSNAVSVNEAEYIALQYYWIFMVVSAFSGSTLAQLGVAYFSGKKEAENTFTTILTDIAQTLPGQVSANWLNWIILRTFIILPQQYMLQMNSFLFQWLGWKCCRRCVMGGGPGGPVPYRIYIDSGVVFLCIVALAPISPLVAPAALIYFLYCTPLWRRNCLYIYRPKFDTGGLRWPFLSDVLISSLCVAQVLLTTAMALKEAIGPAILSALPLVTIILRRRAYRRRYLKSYLDCALLQTSQLDGWDNTVPTSIEKRDEYRRFLVDAHKAAYVPICIAGGSTAALTAEPALVIPHENDILQPSHIPDMQCNDLDHHIATQGGVHHVHSTSDRSLNLTSFTTPKMGIPLAERAKSQNFASVRRLGPFNYNVIDQGDSFNNGDVTDAFSRQN